MKKLLKYKLFESDINRDELFIAIYHDNVDKIKQLIKNGVDINKRNTIDETPLIYASAHGSKNSVKELIKAGADLTAINAFKHKNFIDLATHEIKLWLSTKEAQDIIIPKDPSLVPSFKKNHIIISPIIKEKYPHIFSAMDLNLF